MTNDQNDACVQPNYNSTLLARFCIPEFTSTFATLEKIAKAMSVSEQDSLANVLLDISNAWEVILYMTVVSFLITLVYVFLLRWIAKPLLYVSLVLLLVGMILGGLIIFLQVENYESEPDVQTGMYTGAGMIWFFALIFMLFLCC